MHNMNRSDNYLFHIIKLFFAVLNADYALYELLQTYIKFLCISKWSISLSNLWHIHYCKESFIAVEWLEQ